MIFHPGRTGSCIMRPRRAVSCLLKLNPPARIGKKTRVSVRGTLHVVEIVARNPAGYAQAGGEPKPCQVTRTRGSPGCGVSVTAVRRDAICRSAPMPLSEGGIGSSRRDLCGNTPPWALEGKEGLRSGTSQVGTWRGRNIGTGTGVLESGAHRE